MVIVCNLVPYPAALDAESDDSSDSFITASSPNGKAVEISSGFYYHLYMKYRLVY